MDGPDQVAYFIISYPWTGGRNTEQQARTHQSRTLLPHARGRVTLGRRPIHA